MSVIDIEELLPHRRQEVVCLKCFDRWIAVFPSKVKLVQLECSRCGAGFVIGTGEILE